MSGAGSSTDAPGAGDTAMPPRDGGGNVAHLLRYAETVCLDFDDSSDKWVLTNIISQETITLPEGAWDIEFDDEGFGVIKRREDGYEWSLDDIFMWGVYKDAEGRIVLVTQDEDGKTCDKRFLDHVSEEFVVDEYSLRVGSAAASVKVSIACLSFARDGCNTFWSLVALYKAMALTMFSKIPSRWAWSGFDNGSWAAHLDSMGFSAGHLLRSQCYGEAAGEVGSGRFLPFHAFSSVALVGFLTVWSTMPKNRGGFQRDEHRCAARELLKAVVTMASAGRSVVLDVRLTDKVELRPPRPVFGGNPCKVVVKDGVADLTDFRRVQTRISGQRECAKWWLSRDPFLSTESAPLDELLSYLMKNKAAEGRDLFKQLVAGIGSELDEAICFVNQGGQRPRLAMDSSSSGRLTRYQEDQLVTKHFIACQRLMASHTSDTHFSFATDKARVGGMDLMATYFLLGDGHAMESFPQVPPPPPVRTSLLQNRPLVIVCSSVFPVAKWKALPTCDSFLVVFLFVHRIPGLVGPPTCDSLLVPFFPAQRQLRQRPGGPGPRRRVDRPRMRRGSFQVEGDGEEGAGGAGESAAELVVAEGEARLAGEVFLEAGQEVQKDGVAVDPEGGCAGVCPLCIMSDFAG